MTTTPDQIISQYGIPAELTSAVRAHASNRHWYSISSAGDTADIRIYDEIGYWGISAADFIHILEDLDVTTINLHINSPGGAVWDALAIYHTLRDHPATINAIVDGIAASAASYILQAGDTRTAQPSTRVMVHASRAAIAGTAADLRDYADLLDAVTRDIAAIYATRTGGDVDDWITTLNSGDTWYSADEALAAGLVDTVAPTNQTTLQPTNHANPTKEPTIMPTDDVAATLADHTTAIDGLTRDIQLLATPSAPTGPDLSALATFNSYGEYVKAMATKSDEALAAFAALQAAYTGPAETETVQLPAWLGLILGDMRAKQPVLQMISHTYDLPAHGATVEYSKISSDTTAVSEQANWGDELATGKVVLGEPEGAPVKTYGGWSEYAAQWVERASTASLDLLWRAMALKYARQIEAVARNQFTTAFEAATAAVTTGVALAAMAAVDWRAALIDLVQAVDSTAWPLTGLAASPSVFKQIATTLEQKTALQVDGNPTDKEGTIDLGTLSGKLDGYLLRMIPGWTGDHIGGYYRDSVRVQESPGAPLRLTGEMNVTNLVKPVSLYGYAASYAPIPEAMRPITFA